MASAKCTTRSYGIEDGSIPGVMAATSNSVNTPTGGVGMCGQEYLRTLAAAGFGLELVTFEVDRRPLVRFRRRMRPRPYTCVIPPYVASDVAAVVRKTRARYLFLHMVHTAPLAAPLRGEFGAEVEIVLLSHGLESMDYLHFLRCREEIAAITKAAPARRSYLADQLCAESSQRQYIDHVFCLSPSEAEIERWLGAKAVTWLPRTISGRRLSWRPQGNRIGFVGCLDHPPNADGLMQFAGALDTLAQPEVSLRVAGAPAAVGRRLAERFRSIEYLGPLTDDQLEAEAECWNCFVNPLFCYARGCSTKLAVALGWGIPVLTTPAGSRGYVWSNGNLPMADTPEGLARLAISMMNAETAATARREVQLVVESSPSLDQVAGKVRNALFAGSATRPVFSGQ